MKSISIEGLPAEAVELIKDVLDIIVSADEEIVLKENGKTVYTIAKGAINKNEILIDFSQEAKQDKSKRVPGTAKGQVWISSDFDELPDDIARAFGMID